MTFFLANIVAIAAVGFLVLRRGRERRVESVRSARWLRIAALIPLALQAAVFLLFGIGEMASGDLSGAGHLWQLAVTVLLAILGWMRPLEGGAALFVAGALLAIQMFSAGHGAESAVMSPALVILAAPLLVAGALFFVAGIFARSATTGAARQ